MTRAAARTLPLKSLALAAAACAAAAPATASLLEYERSAILSGEIWRILTAHVTHCGAYHLIWNVLPLLGIGFLFEEALGRRFWPVFLASCVVITGGLLLFDPALDSYRGLSGALNGIWVAGALAAARAEAGEGRRLLAAIYRCCVLGDLLKIAWEAATGAPVFTDPSALHGDPIPLAHVLGAVVGLCASTSSRAEALGPSRHAVSM